MYCARHGLPGRFNPPAPIVLAADGTDSGKSWSVSLSQQLPRGIRPYATYAETSLMLDGSNNVIAVNVVQAGHLGSATLKEAGIKAALFQDKLMITTAAYDQTRTDVAAPSDPGAGANVSSTRYRGVETEIKFAPFRNLFVSAYALFQSGKYIVAVPAGTNVDVSGRDLGFQDIVDPATGQVLFPAEAFLYGGRPQLVLLGQQHPVRRSHRRPRDADRFQRELPVRQRARLLRRRQSFRGGMGGSHQVGEAAFGDADRCGCHLRPRYLGTSSRTPTT